MTVVNPKSISGINSITMASGSDNLLTIHTTNTTERVRVNSDGDVIVGSGITVSPDGNIFATGVTTATTFVGALTGNVTGNTSGTAGGLTGTPNISCGTIAGSTGTFSGDVNVGAGITLDASAGIVTAANEVSAGRISMLTVNTGGRLVTSGAFLTIQAATGTVIEDLDGNNQIKGNDGGSVQLYHNGTEQCATSASGLAFPSGKGIDFSATSDASGQTSELLDDYEEGSWTPNIRNDGTTSTWNSQQGRYVKIGQQVTVWFNADGGTSPRSGGTSSSLIMTGLPFSQVMFGNPILGSVGANKSSGSGLYSTIGVILSPFGQGGTQVRFGAGGQAINFGIDYVAGCFTYTAS